MHFKLTHYGLAQSIWSWPWAAISLSLALCCGAAQACNVPVFRFALERWRPDPYRVVLFHRGPLSDAQRELIRPLEEQQDKSLANVIFRAVDANELDDNKARGLFESQRDLQLPWLVVQYPEYLQIDAPISAEPLSDAAVARLTDSPVRQELVRRLASGQTAVWLMLESGQRELDDAAAAHLTEELKRLEQELKLPELTTSPDDELRINTPLRIAFSLLRVPRGNVTEQAVVDMLLRSEPDLADRTEPIVFPVFGRGRALFGLVGAGITAANIQESAAFLVGPCSCQVKELNPGFDLLLAADWDNLLAQEGVPLIAVTTRQPIQPTEAELVPIPSGSPPAPVVVSAETIRKPEKSATGFTRAQILIGCVTLASLLVILSLIVRPRRAAVLGGTEGNRGHGEIKK